MTVRKWLRSNNYNDIADMINEILAEFETTRSKERRNWADVLCGRDGKPVTIAGRTFPMLKSAQRSRGVSVAPDAIQRSENEEFPVARVTGRWPKKTKLPSRTKQLVKRSNRSARARRAS